MGLKRLPEGFQLMHKVVQAAGKAGLQAPDFPEGFHTGPGLIVAHAIAQQHRTQPGLPGVALQLGGQVQAFPVLAVQTPADIGALDPATSQGDLVFIDPETVPYAGYFQQADDLTHRKTTAGQ